ncbi:MAG TPA: hypothetical protein VJ001_08380, partial [Rhodocyclaceae bacterium]|nr:hypothetical protein [Rhodocyclaceae bacterium]
MRGAGVAVVELLPGLGGLVVELGADVDGLVLPLLPKPLKLGNIGGPPEPMEVGAGETAAPPTIPGGIAIGGGNDD